MKKEVLIEEDGFQLLAQPDEYWASWISHHDCPSEVNLPSDASWRLVDMFEEECRYCSALVPEGLLGAWKLHNYDHYANALRLRARIRNVNCP